jgi:4'-phosphopantetheinyl transferase
MDAVAVDVTYWDLARQRGRLDTLAALLSPEETARAGRFALPALRERFVLAHGILRETLAAMTGVPAAALVFDRGPDGKPELVDGEVSFNLSKSEDGLLIATARGNAVGCDLERLRPNAEAKAIAARWFSAVERAALEAREGADFDRAFMTLWVRKEALLKAAGTGLQGSLGIDTGDPAPVDAARAVVPGERRFWIADLSPTAGFVAAVAAERPMALRLTVNA